MQKDITFVKCLFNSLKVTVEVHVLCAACAFDIHKANFVHKCFE